ncbi:MAG: hypothetical protein ABI895_36325 [Deltaproteobacteria bacterium]
MRVEHGERFSEEGRVRYGKPDGRIQLEDPWLVAGAEYRLGGGVSGVQAGERNHAALEQATH